MRREPLNILGIPVDNLNIIETVDEIMASIRKYQEDKQPRYVSTLNTHFLSNVISWNLTKTHHPEILRILRNSSLVTADGMPIVWLSRWLNPPLKERVTGADLLEQVAKALGIRKMSLYLLGGEGFITQEAAEILKSHYPGLKIAGVSSPMISIEGADLLHANERDALIIEDINDAAPDVLALNLGHPKQEIWFERIRHHLKVPVTIGVGGSFSFVTKTLPRAPEWMQRIGCEWLYRLALEPRRLWKRYIVSGVKFVYATAPLLLYNGINKLITRLIHRRHEPHSRRRKNFLFISPEKTITVVPVPLHLSKESTPKLSFFLSEAFSQDVVILDFRHLRHLDAQGAGLLVQTWLEARQTNREIYGLGMSSDVRFLLQCHHAWDLLADDLYPSAEGILRHTRHKDHTYPLYESVQQEGDTVILSFIGRLDSSQDYSAYIKKFEPILCDKSCIIDFSYCTHIDNAGFSFLLRMREILEEQKQQLKLCDISKGLRKEFRLAKIARYFSIYSTLEAALTAKTP